MDYAVMIAIIGAIQAVVVAVIVGLFNREAKNRKSFEDESEKRATQRARESLLAMKMMSANATLAIATGLAVKEGRANGKMDIAIAEAEKAQREYYNFINELASEQISLK
jgi:hypothetical protein